MKNISSTNIRTNANKPTPGTNVYPEGGILYRSHGVGVFHKYMKMYNE